MNYWIYGRKYQAVDCRSMGCQVFSVGLVLEDFALLKFNMDRGMKRNIGVFIIPLFLL